MNCLYCGGEMEKKESAYTVDRKGYHLFIEKIPALICIKCGEKAYEEKEVEAIQNMISNLENSLTRVREAV